MLNDTYQNTLQHLVRRSPSPVGAPISFTGGSLFSGRPQRNSFGAGAHNNHAFMQQLMNWYRGLAMPQMMNGSGARLGPASNFSGRFRAPRPMPRTSWGISHNFAPFAGSMTQSNQMDTF